MNNQNIFHLNTPEMNARRIALNERLNKINGIGNNVVIGANSVVNKDVQKPRTHSESVC